MDTLAISIIIPIYILDTETEEMTKRCIESFGDRDEIIVVDDCSPYPHSIPCTIRNPSNYGVAKSWNIGVAQATKEVILIANSDTEAVCWRKPMLDALKEADVVFPHIFNNDTGRIERHLAGEFFMFRKSFIDRIGLFDESFGSYFEDTDWFARVMEYGGRLTVAADTLVNHRSQGTFKKAKSREWIKENFERNRELFAKKHTIYPYINY